MDEQTNRLVHCHADSLLCYVVVYLLGLVICNWAVLLSMLITIWCTFDSAGRSWVKMKKYQRSMRESESRFNYKRSGSMNRNWRQRSATIHIFFGFCIYLHSQFAFDSLCFVTFCVVDYRHAIASSYVSYCANLFDIVVVVVVVVAEKLFVLIKTAGIIGAAYCFVVWAHRSIIETHLLILHVCWAISFVN